MKLFKKLAASALSAIIVAGACAAFAYVPAYADQTNPEVRKFTEEAIAAGIPQENINEELQYWADAISAGKFRDAHAEGVWNEERQYPFGEDGVYYWEVNKDFGHPAPGTNEWYFSVTCKESLGNLDESDPEVIRKLRAEWEKGDQKIPFNKFVKAENDRLGAKKAAPEIRLPEPPQGTPVVEIIPTVIQHVTDSESFSGPAGSYRLTGTAYYNDKTTTGTPGLTDIYLDWTSGNRDYQFTPGHSSVPVGSYNASCRSTTIYPPDAGWVGNNTASAQYTPEVDTCTVNVY